MATLVPAEPPPETDIGDGEGHVVKLQKEVQETVGLMKQNVEKVLDRGRRLEDAEMQADELELYTREYQQTTKTIRSKYCWANWNTSTYVIAIIAVLLVMVTVIIILMTKPWESVLAGGT